MTSLPMKRGRVFVPAHVSGGGGTIYLNFLRLEEEY